MRSERHSIAFLVFSLEKAQRRVCACPREALPPAAAWLRDNGRALYALAKTAAVPRGKTAAVYALCRDFAAAAGGPVGENALCRALRAGDAALTAEELRAVPGLLKYALLCRLYDLLPRITAECRAARQGDKFASGHPGRLPEDPVALGRALEALSAAGDGAALGALEARLRQKGLNPRALMRQGREALARTAEETGAVITALQSADRLDGERICQKCSPAAALLRGHPVFSAMDRAGRALYLTAVSRLSRQTRVSEREVCRAALALCEGKEGAAGDPGFYLLENPGALRRALGKRPGLSPRGRVRLYVSLVLLGDAACWTAGLFLLPWYGALPFGLAATAAVHALIQRGAARILPRRPLPRLRPAAFPAGTRALVAVPTLLSSKAEALAACRRLSVTYLANESAPADYLLLGDLPDAGEETLPQDEEIVSAAASGIAALRQAYGPHFQLLLRDRSLNAADSRWTGRERKRGALALLNRLLAGEEPGEVLLRSTLPPAAYARRYTHVITLDSDTLLPAGAAEKLLGAMLHPLQRGRVAVIQPRMLTLALHVRTRAQKNLGGFSGAEVYGGAAADLYQDAFGRGTYMGKGIYDPALFSAAAILPPGRVLSHDLIEGELAGAALAEDIVCYDGHPRTVAGFLRRLHRWTRGDWQLTPFLRDGRLDALSRMKLLDTWRRSLVPLGRLLALGVSAYTGAALPFALMLLPPRIPLLLLPAGALTRLDALLRAQWRLRVSGKKLLEWTPAAQAEEGGGLLRRYLPPLLCGVAMLFASAASAFAPGFLLGAMWLLYPLAVRWLDAPLSGPAPLSPRQKRFLLSAARDTLGFFERYVTADTHFLPPDNVQLSPRRGPAPRTSPTNIGLYLLALCAAQRLGLLTEEGLLARMEPTVDTLERLPTWQGIPYNWYDLRTLSPLPPRDISSVDAGNCLVCLMTAAQALRALRRPSDLPARLDALAQRMEIRRLYDRKARLFSVSLREDGTPLPGHYDLLASESRLLSFAAIVRGAVGEGHWARLGRPFAALPRPTLLSWSGTVFEYMMPALLLPAWPGTLLHAARSRAMAAQRRAGRQGFFGVSESGYAQFDPSLDYRYRAFGVGSLALSAAETGRVYAPYAAALALPAAPRAACRALMAFRKTGVYGPLGFYEAIDCQGPEPKIVYSAMAHHQGMLLCALCNALTGDSLPRLFASLPRVQAHLPLLCESAPRHAAPLPAPLRRHRDALPLAPLRIRPGEGDPPDAWALSGGGASLLVDARGGSRLMAEDIALTRQRPESLNGPQLYLAAPERPPLRLTGGEYAFLEGAAQCVVSAPGLRSEVTVCLSPLTGAAVYRVRLRSTAAKRQTLSLIFYMEPALERPADDGAHMAFSNLFLTVGRDGEGCLLRRRVRPGGQVRACRVRAYLPCEITDDRALFLGREGDMERPLGLTADWRMTGGPEPCAALRVRVELPPGRETVTCFSLGETVPDTLEEALDAFSLAATRSLTQRRIAGADAALAALAARLAGRLLHPQSAPAPAAPRALWPLGLGDEPFLLVTAEEEGALPALTRIGRAFALLCQQGLRARLVLVLPREEGYDRPLRTACEGLLLPRTLILSDPAERPALEALCAFALRADAPLEAQLRPSPSPPALYAAAPGGQLPPLPRLLCYNGFGGFAPEGAYTVRRTAPAAWCHILCNEGFGTLVCEQGILYSYIGNSRLRRLTRVCQDSVVTLPSEEYLIVENGQSWSLTRRPLGNAACHVTYEMGAAVYRCALPGLDAALTCFAAGDAPCGGRLLTLRSTAALPRALTVTGRAYFALGENGRGTCVRAADGLTYARGDLPGLAFYALADSRAEAEGALGVLRRDITLRPGERVTLAFWLGWSESEDAALALLARLSPREERNARGAWQRRLERLQCYLPEAPLSTWLNTFLPYQLYASRLFMRGGFWQSGGAWGFRDQLQDMLPLAYTAPDRLRAHLLLCASRQYEEGDVQHWWHPGGAGVRTRIADDRLFLPWAAAWYVRVTGDRDVLKEEIPFLSSPPLADGERDRYETPEAAPRAASLLVHCLRAIDSVDFGPHGIPRMGGGDWNDGMDQVGGESVWLGFFLLLVLRDFAPLCDEKTGDALDRRRIRLHTALQSAWTGRWFLRAWYPDGRSIGAPDSPVPRIDLISQCFAAFAGMPRNQVSAALQSAWDALHRKDLGITLLLSPPFAPEEKAGYIGLYNPGVRENGGQYTHALPWFMRALLMNGQTDRAWQLLRETLPFSHADTPEKADRYRAEPYVLAGDIHLSGRGGWTWYTGSAGQMYLVILHDFLGFDKKGDGVRLCPKVPPEWTECTVLYRYGASRYQLTASRDQPYITLDGEKKTGAYVPLTDDGRAHEIRFPIM